ncbi:MAG: flippase-like domain-containing protein [Verrucomicrobiales bacterium]|nr:flippase-like domain-containing protein [Verrucomicrobiales bacterium]
MKGRAKKLWSVSWRLGIAGLLLAWAFHAVFHDQCRTILASQGVNLDALPRLERWLRVWRLGPLALGQTIVNVQSGWLMASVALWGITIALGAWRWLLVLRSQGLDPGFKRTLEISFIAHFFNSFLLGSTGGDLLKAYYAARVTHHLKTEAVTSVLMDRVLGLFAMLAFAVVMLIPNATLVLRYSKTIVLALVILGMFGAASGFLLFSLRGGLSNVLPGARGWLRRLPMAETLERGLEACRKLGHARGLLLRALLLSFLLTFVCVAQLLTLIWGYGLSVPLTPIFLIVPAVICISALPVTPNGLGVRDYLYLYLLSLPELGVSAGTAVAVSLVAFAGSLVWSAIGGALYVFLRREQDLA